MTGVTRGDGTEGGLEGKGKGGEIGEQGGEEGGVQEVVPSWSNWMAIMII